MKKTNKLLKILSLILCLNLLLASCELFNFNFGSTDTKKVEEPQEFDLLEYTVIRADDADESIVSVVSTFYTSLRKVVSGVRFSTDYVNTAKNETVPTDTKEILVGATNRAESRGIRYNDSAVYVENNRIVINGGCSSALKRATEWFLKNCIYEDGIAEVPVEGYSFSPSYALGGLTVSGIPLRDFALETANCTVDRELAEWLGKNVGTLTKSEHKIQIVSDESLGLSEVSILEKDGNIILSYSPYLGDNHGLVTSRFMEILESAESGEVILEGKESIEMGQIKSVHDEDVQELRNTTDQMIANIRNAANLTPTGTVYYVDSENGNDSKSGTSPATAWKTIEKVNNKSLSSGTTVCFKRGCIWRGETLVCQSGVTYTAYGTGEKPKFYGSFENGANPSKWTEVATNIWYYQGSEDMNDVGGLVFNDGEQVSTKVTLLVEWNKSLKKYKTYNLQNYTFSNLPLGSDFSDYKDLSEDLQMYHDSTFTVVVNVDGTSQNYTHTGTKKLYLYSTSNPGERFDSIEFLNGKSIINATGNNITVDNICVMYGGVHGVGASGNSQSKIIKNLTVQNCEFGWLGGSSQKDNMGRNYQTRLGNAVEIYGACNGFTVQNNYIHQIYDTGMTVQANPANVNKDLRNDLYMKNVKYLNNVIENCEMAFEIWMTDIAEENPSRMYNYLVEGNYVWYTSYGFCEQRPRIDQGWSAAVKNRCGGSGNRAYNYTIRNNVFAFWKNRALQCTSNLFNPEDGSDSLPNLSGNIYVESYGKKFGQFEITVTGDSSHVDTTYDFNTSLYLAKHETATNKAYLTEGHTDGTEQFWFYSK